jgi:hypothetical protein
VVDAEATNENAFMATALEAVVVELLIATTYIFRREMP